PVGATLVVALGPAPGVLLRIGTRVIATSPLVPRAKAPARARTDRSARAAGAVSGLPSTRRRDATRCVGALRSPPRRSDRAATARRRPRARARSGPARRRSWKWPA